ncbi:MAG: hypothetical protein IT537_08035 [Hyphomicrobiales bacterium]|nr:hypothetical protein [Hyphomicrobiales bacterium]
MQLRFDDMGCAEWGARSCIEQLAPQHQILGLEPADGCSHLMSMEASQHHLDRRIIAVGKSRDPGFGSRIGERLQMPLQHRFLPRVRGCAFERRSDAIELRSGQIALEYRRFEVPTPPAANSVRSFICTLSLL